MRLINPKRLRKKIIIFIQTWVIIAMIRKAINNIADNFS